MFLNYVALFLACFLLMLGEQESKREKIDSCSVRDASLLFNSLHFGTVCCAHNESVLSKAAFCHANSFCRRSDLARVQSLQSHGLKHLLPDQSQVMCFLLETASIVDLFPPVVGPSLRNYPEAFKFPHRMRK